MCRTRGQQSNTDQQISFRNRWSSSTSSRIASGSWSRCHRHSSRPAQVSGRAHGMTARRASLGHRDLATHPGAGLLDRLTRTRVLRLSRLEEVKDVLRARCRPQGEELVIRIGEGSTAADRHETRVAVFREDHTQHPSTRNCPTPNTMFPAPAFSVTRTKQTSNRPRSERAFGQVL